jgi:hypothetical protein
MPFSNTVNSSKSWRDYFLHSKDVAYSNLLLEKIRNSVEPSCPFISSVSEISKNPGITFLSLDASEEKLQLFHHATVTGGSWMDDKEKLVDLLGSHHEIIPIQIMTNSIKEVKENKIHSVEQLVNKIKTKNSLDYDRLAKLDFHNYNILPIPALLTQVFLSLDDTDSSSVALAFFQSMYELDYGDTDPNDENSIGNANSVSDSQDVNMDTPQLSTTDEEAGKIDQAETIILLKTRLWTNSSTFYNFVSNVTGRK